jgi:AraC-like DNA-binding protein
VVPGLIIGHYEATRIASYAHEAVSLVLPLSRFYLSSGDREVNTDPGDICVVNTFGLHGTISRGAPCKARTIHVCPELLMSVANLAGARAAIPHFDESPIHDPQLAEALSHLWEELARPLVTSDAAIQCEALLQQLVFRHAIDWQCDRADSRAAKAIRRVQQYLQAHVADTITLDEMADLACISRSYLIREFHRWVGLPPHAYQSQLRAARAARLLAGGASLSRAAFESGFADQSHLSRRFKTSYGVTPLAFARAMRNEPPIGSRTQSERPIPHAALSFKSDVPDTARRVV